MVKDELMKVEIMKNGLSIQISMKKRYPNHGYSCK